MPLINACLEAALAQTLSTLVTQFCGGCVCSIRFIRQAAIQAAMVNCKVPHLASQGTGAGLCAAEGEVTLHCVQDFKKRVDLESMSAAYSRIRTSTGITEGATSTYGHAWTSMHTAQLRPMC